MFGDLHKISSLSHSYSLEGEVSIALSLLRSIIEAHDFEAITSELAAARIEEIKPV